MNNLGIFGIHMFHHRVEVCISLQGPLSAWIDGTTAVIGDVTTAVEGETIATTIGAGAADRGLALGIGGGRDLVTELQEHLGTGGQGLGRETEATEVGV